MTMEQYYGDELIGLQRAEQLLMNIINEYHCKDTTEDIQPIIYSKSRIKSPESMIRKLEKLGLPTDRHTAVSEMHDAVGARVVCSFVDNVYEVAEWLRNREEIRIIEKKDYISHPKPNGYRSLHLIVEFTQDNNNGIKAEIQLRTIAIDFWSALEHQIKYKKNIEHEKTIRSELKRCADEIASIDMSMQTIRDVLNEDDWK